ncbi:MAG TPA: hypothetical protein VL992_05445, partial [Tepidisphaeraceae bacterium]|nr:hypothetical protein [Tepidisphaeraceae bacterium]
QDIGGRLPAPAWIVTSIMNFRWNRLILDGQAVPFDRTNNLFFHEAAFLSAGQHQIGYRFEPDAIWSELSMISWIVLAASTVAAIVMFLQSPTTKVR